MPGLRAMAEADYELSLVVTAGEQEGFLVVCCYKDINVNAIRC
jgi:hypothetical protein